MEDEEEQSQSPLQIQPSNQERENSDNGSDTIQPGAPIPPPGPKNNKKALKITT